MPRKKKQPLVHFDIDSLSKQTEQRNVEQRTSLGEILRARREKKKLSIEDVSHKLCIKEVYIKALEDGHYYAFPSRVYGIGFLRSYAKFLGLDSDLMVAEFHAETSDIKEAPMDMPIVEKHLALPSKKTLIIFAALIFAAIVLWFTAATLLSTDIFSKLPAPYKVELSEQNNTPVEAAPVIPDEAVITETPVSMPEELPKEEPAPEKKVSPEAMKAEVAFIAKSDVWVRLYNTETKKVILDKVLHKNDSFAPEAQLSVLELSTGRGNSLELYKKGEKVKTFGHEKSLSLSDLADSKN